MVDEPVVTPSLVSPTTLLVDWLELIAFFNAFSIARLDVLVAAIEEQKDEHEENIAIQDEQLDRLREQIENEIDARKIACGDSYPFELSEDAEEFKFIGDLSSETAIFYLVCLLTSHLVSSEIMERDASDDLINRLRNQIFQTVSVIAMAGLARGSAASIGWPRNRGETIIQVLQRAQKCGAGIIPRNKPGKYTAPKEKDGGIDIISWSQDDRPPNTIFYYAQVASGRNWHGKPVGIYIDRFQKNYMDDGPRGNVCHATLIPFRVTDLTDWFSEHQDHKAILDRTRLPKHAIEGMKLFQDGVEMDETENLCKVTQWLEDFRFSFMGD